jgi:hypothetical protein
MEDGKWQMANGKFNRADLCPSMAKRSYCGLRRVICSLHISIFDLQFLYESDGASFPAAAAPGD